MRGGGPKSLRILPLEFEPGGGAGTVAPPAQKGWVDGLRLGGWGLGRKTDRLEGGVWLALARSASLKGQFGQILFLISFSNLIPDQSFNQSINQSANVSK